MDNSRFETSVGDIAFVLFKRKWSLIVVTLTGLLATAIWLFAIRDELFAAHAKVLVKLGQEQASPSTVLGAAPPLIGYRSQEVNSEVEILKNSELLGMVVDEMHLDRPTPPVPPPTGFVPLVRYRLKNTVAQVRDYVDETLISIGLRERLTLREKAINMLAGGLKVEAEKDSNVFSAQMLLPVRRGASVVLNRMLDRYLSFRLKIYQNRGVEFFQEGVSNVGTDLQEAEQELQQFESDGNISLLQEQQAQLIKQIGETEAAVHDAQLALNDSTYRVSRLEEELKKDEPNFGAVGDFETNSFPSGILRQLAQLQQEREALRMTQLDSGEKIKNNRSQFGVLVQMLAANLRSNLETKRDDHRMRQEALDGFQTQLQNLHSKQMNWIELRRKSGAHEESLTFYRRKLQEASAAAAMERERIGNVIIIQPAMDSLQPVGLRKTTLFGLAALVSVFLAICWICLLELLDHRIYNMEPLETQLGLPVFAVVPAGIVVPRIPTIQTQEPDVSET